MTARDGEALLRAIVETRSFTNGTPQNLQLSPDGSRAFFLRGEARSSDLRLYAFELATGTERELASAGSVLGGGGESISSDERARRERMRITARGIVGYELARDGSGLLFQLGGRAWLLELAPADASGAANVGAAPPLCEVAGPDAAGAPIFDPRLSPDGQLCAFVRAGELWVVPLDRSWPARQLTHGATKTLLHARAEFVAQEELARFRGFWWAPDSRRLVYEEVDESGVETLHLQDPAHEFRAPTHQAYPRPGRANARTRFGIVALDDAKSGRLAETRWLAREPRWEYVARVEWPAGGPLLLVVLTRDQRTLALLACDEAGETRTLLEEHDPLFLNSARELRWLRDGAGFLWSSETSGASQLEHRAASGERLATLTPDGLRFSSLAGLDEEGATLFVHAHPTPLRSELWTLPLRAGGDGLRRLAPSDGVEESVAAVFAREGRAHLRVITPLRGPPRFEAVRADGSQAGLLRSVAQAPPFEPRLEFAQLGPAPLVAGGRPARDGGFHTLLVRPRDFDPHRRYPAIVQVYGGPHALTVKAQASAYLLDQWIADHGFLVLRADNRGTPLRGRDWERAIAHRFAEVPLDDQIAVLQAWAAREPALDLSRVGVMGHSFGGYLAALAVLRRPDVFHAAVAGAPVVDWMNYDTAYTERYLGVPPPAGTSAVYARNGLLEYAAAPMQPRPLFLSHGTADDNVHFSETLLLCDALFRARKPFELLPQVGQTHQFHEPELMVIYWERVFDFFRTHLGSALATGT